MSITVYPYKLTQRELEARLEPGLSVLPGQYLRFESPEPVFAQVREVQALPSTEPGLSGGYRLTIALLYGTPSLQPQQATLMTPAQLGQAIQQLQEPLAEPLRLSPEFSAELSRLGPLTVIGGDDFLQKLEVLQRVIEAIQPHRRVVILDPLGVFEGMFAEDDGAAGWQAGRDVRLSVQTVGSKHFLDAFGELFAPSLRESALRVVADHLPPMTEFMGFQGLLDWYSALNVPLKNLILQNCQQVAQSQVFADTPAQALDWRRADKQAVTVLDLSGLSEPWRGLFYREALQSLFQQAGDAVVPVLIYPEHYLPELAQWVQKADEAELKLLMLASPYVSDAVLHMANNRFWTEAPGEVSLQGTLTLGLPLGSLPLSGLPRKRPQEHVSGPVSETVLDPVSNQISGQLSDDEIMVPALLREKPSEQSVTFVAGPESEPVQQERASEAGGGLYSSFSIPLYENDAAPFEPEIVQPDLSELESGENQEPPSMAEQHAPEIPHVKPPPAETAPYPGLAGLGSAGMDETAPFVAVTTTAVVVAPVPVADSMSGLDLPSSAGVVDLAAPSPQATPEFLSASQLSELLNAVPAQAPDPPALASPDSAASVAPEPAQPSHLPKPTQPLTPAESANLPAGDAPAEMMPSSVDTQAVAFALQSHPPLEETDPMNHPLAAPEAASTEADALLSNAATAPEDFDFPLVALDAWEATQATAATDAPLVEPVASSSLEFPVLELAPPPEAAVSPPVEVSPSPSHLSPSPLPPFPSPEEYEAEEFHFELDPTKPVTATPLTAPPGQESELSRSGDPLGQSAVAQSLAAFASLDEPEPSIFSDSFLEASPPQPSSASSSELSYAPNDVSSSAPDWTSAPSSAVSALDSDQDLQEALDLIFPYKFEARPPEEAPAAVAQTPPPVVDEPMAILPKSVESVASDASGFHAGDRVTHPTYGMGVVQKVIPMEESVVLNIVFDGVGKRLLDPALCELGREALVH